MSLVKGQNFKSISDYFGDTFSGQDVKKVMHLPPDDSSRGRVSTNQVTLTSLQVTANFNILQWNANCVQLNWLGKIHVYKMTPIGNHIEESNCLLCQIWPWPKDQVQIGLCHSSKTCRILSARYRHYKYFDHQWITSNWRIQLQYQIWPWPKDQGHIEYFW